LPDRERKIVAFNAISGDGSEIETERSENFFLTGFVNEIRKH
jgi:hypothetical protein